MIVALIGWLGAGLLLIAYGLLSTRRLRAQDVIYQLMNIFGSVCLIINAVNNNAWPFVVLNVIWAVVGLVTVIRVKLHSGENA